MPNDERILETTPVGSLGLIPTDSCKELGDKVDFYLKQWTSIIMRLLSRITTKTAMSFTLTLQDSVPEKLSVLLISLYVVMIYISWLMLPTTVLLTKCADRKITCHQTITTQTLRESLLQ